MYKGEGCGTALMTPRYKQNLPLISYYFLLNVSLVTTIICTTYPFLQQGIYISIQFTNSILDGF